MGSQNRKPQKPVFLYFIIVLLTAALAACGVLTFFSMDRLITLQAKVASLQQTVQELSETSASLTEKAAELQDLETQEQALSSGENSPEPPPESETPAAENGELSGEGMISPSHSQGAFSENSNAGLDNLLSQIQALLPQNNGEWAVYVSNLAENSEGSINEHPMQAASLIKLYIMGAVYENYDVLAGQYGGETLDGTLKSMITVSDNDAANTLVSWLGAGDSAAGMNAVNAFCREHGFANTSMGRLLLASRENGDNYTSVGDCGKFLREVYQLSSGIATDSTLSNAEAMYGLLKLQERRNKIPAAMPEGVHVANKTGELDTVENDAGIIYDTPGGNDLVICFMSENLTDVGAAQSSIAQNSRLIYGYYNE